MDAVGWALLWLGIGIFIGWGVTDLLHRLRDRDG